MKTIAANPTLNGATSGVLRLEEVRARAAAALAPLTDQDPDVDPNGDIADSVSPPALMLVWQDPWLQPQTMGPCLWQARLAVRCVAGRYEPGPGVETLEQLVAYATGRLQGEGWPVAMVSPPRAWVIGGVRYLFADVTYLITITT